jgi:hypothetical protein
MRNLVRVANTTPEKHTFKPSTFYKWAHLKKYPEIFIKVSGALFVDVDALDRLFEKGRLGSADAR